MVPSRMVLGPFRQALCCKDHCVTFPKVQETIKDEKAQSKNPSKKMKFGLSFLSSFLVQRTCVIALR